VDARDESFALDDLVDLVTAMYLFHCAPTVDHLAKICRQIARNLKSGCRFVTYTINLEH
jgi:hypothetical protein